MKNLLSITVLSLYAVAGASAFAEPPQRIYSLVVYGNDACPPSEGDEIVVCARKPESERYRIPKTLRDKPALSGGPGWGSQVANMEAVGRQTLPGSCSVNGSYGFTGCTAAALRQWFAERRMQQSAGVP
ncbi:hypothetical protein [Sphingobium sp. SCG-1]|uniref:hypothetical protein n=1 Tax=Sphingobium sp. SCG-1 TaxID=2072936 RepID=UPI001CB8D44A|nr:hypothetical protein [Sphingobium sp. SCG-1]